MGLRTSQLTERQIKIASHTQDYSIKTKLNGNIYIIYSEDLGIQNPHIITRAYHKGKIIYSHKINYEGILNEQDFKRRLSELLKHQQQIAIETLKMEKAEPERMHQRNENIREGKNIATKKRTIKEYVNEVETLIRTKSQNEAFEVLREVLEQYPNNPTLLSYLGYLKALVNKQYAEGIKSCRQSFKILKDQMSLVEGFFLPLLYLNLGRTYLIAGKKKDAYFLPAIK